jgi:hypothetical protein
MREVVIVHDPDIEAGTLAMNTLADALGGMRQARRTYANDERIRRLMSDWVYSGASREWFVAEVRKLYPDTKIRPGTPDAR